MDIKLNPDNNKIGSNAKLPIGVQNFEILREGGYVYVDKTEYIYDIVHNYRQVFLNRPRRFGKSLLLSSLRAYWEGRKDLFTGLAIESLAQQDGYAWSKHPVFYFDFNRDNYSEHGALEGILEAHVSTWESEYGVDGKDDGKSLAVRFQNLLVRAHESTGLKCVVLVDEYDKPLLEVMQDSMLEKHNKDVFKGFFSTLKSYDEYLEFVFLTGITRFSKVSIFSDLNHLKDISMNPEYAAVCGITDDEVDEYFAGEIERMASQECIDCDECRDRLRDYYDGYLFHQNGPAVYNPFSLLNALSDGGFRSYWFSTGTPTFLAKMVKERNFGIKQFVDDSLTASERDISDYQVDNPELVPLLYQTGYLTIKDYDKDGGFYTLALPNNEVKYGLLESLLPEYAEGTEAGSGKDILSIRRYVTEGDLEGLREAITALFASLPYATTDVALETNFQNVLFVVFTLLGQYVQCEVHSARGRADCVVQTKDYVYIFEFKRDGSSDEALNQIEEKGYAEPFAADKRKVYRIGANFDSETKTLSEWKISQ